LIRLPVIRPVDLIAILKKAGFVEKRQRGSHVVLWNETTRRTTIVPLHGRDLPPPLLKQILRQAGIAESVFRNRR
jgi:predicted RNA binding protein YcfA (HicA-like mRNA interferase family)